MFTITAKKKQSQHLNIISTAIYQMNIGLALLPPTFFSTSPKRILIENSADVQ